ncbi:hypothetical protein D3C76_731380 [compost metagenome]
MCGFRFGKLAELRKPDIPIYEMVRAGETDGVPARKQQSRAESPSGRQRLVFRKMAKRAVTTVRVMLRPE